MDLLAEAAGRRTPPEYPHPDSVEAVGVSQEQLDAMPEYPDPEDDALSPMDLYDMIEKLGDRVAELEGGGGPVRDLYGRAARLSGRVTELESRLAAFRGTPLTDAEAGVLRAAVSEVTREEIPATLEALVQERAVSALKGRAVDLLREQVLTQVLGPNTKGGKP